MKKWLLGLLTAVILVFGLSAVTTANAASWHKGTPSSLRGQYMYQHKGHARGQDWYSIGKSSYTFTPTGTSASKTTGVKYEKIGKYYRLKGTIHAYGRKFSDDKVFYKKGSKLKAVSYSQYKNSHFSKDKYTFNKR